MMFENLLATQPHIAQRLASELHSGSFPQSVLFTGPAYSGRMTAAIEVARVLSCQQHGDALCNCPSCQQYRELENTNMVIVSARDHQSVVTTALANFERGRNQSSRIFLIRSIRILLMQYHGALMESATTKTSQASYESASEISRMLIELSSMDDDTTEAAVKKLVGSLRTAIAPLLQASRKNTAVNIGQIRAIQEWTTMTSMEKVPRIVVIEALEQSTEGARNSLLKMLEEPPQDVYFILLTENPGRIMQTILSRVRKYTFPPISPASKDLLLRDVFHAGAGSFDSLQGYFLSGGGVNCAQLEQLCRNYLDGALSRADYSYDDLMAFGTEVENSGQFAFVCSRMMDILSQMVTQHLVGPSLAGSMLGEVNSMFNKSMAFNQGRRLTLEVLYQHLRELAAQ